MFFRKIIPVLLAVLAPWAEIRSQCDPFLPGSLSKRPANYDISVRLDDQNRTLSADQSIRFVNQSPVPVQTLRLYLYLNAFKNTESTFLKGATNVFGQKFDNRKPEEWGWVNILSFARTGAGGPTDLRAGMKFVQPDDGNPEDQSVLEVALDKPLAPGDSAVFQLKWTARIPKTIARAGYSRDFYLFCHWFPQLGVWEQDKNGKWDWNCHQFFRRTEFYADFGVYDVRITTDSKYKMGASGCLVTAVNNPDGTTTRHYHAEDVIDFAWSIYPYFQEITDQWNGVYIRLMLPPEHAAMGPRYLYILKFALEYLEKHVGKYPYPSITVVDPPFHGLRSGMMEYPTLITVGTFYGIPEYVRTSESLLIHEFTHQYFMGVLASNEKEEPWLDEGFTTYFEDRILDAAFGEKQSLLAFPGFHFGNKEQTRIEYTSMRNPRDGSVARPGWEFSDFNFKSLIYSKTATSLRTLQEIIGEEAMNNILRTYFERWKFAHPRGSDFMTVLREELAKMPDTTLAVNAYRLFETAIYDTKVMDYAVSSIENEILPGRQGVFGDSVQTVEDGSSGKRHVSRVEVQRRGDWVYPVELLVSFEDGSTRLEHWSGEAGVHVFEFYDMPPVVSAQLDPHGKLGLDTDINNNSLTLQPEHAPLWKYALKFTFWIQNLFQAITFLV